MEESLFPLRSGSNRSMETSKDLNVKVDSKVRSMAKRWQSGSKTRKDRIRMDKIGKSGAQSIAIRGVLWSSALFELGHRQIFRRLSAPMQIVQNQESQESWIVLDSLGPSAISVLCLEQPTFGTSGTRVFRLESPQVYTELLNGAAELLWSLFAVHGCTRLLYSFVK